METALQAVEVILPNVYLAALFLFAGHFARGAAWAGRCGRRTLVVAVLLHAVALGLRRPVLGHYPPATALEAMSCVAHATGIVYLLIEPRSEERTTGILVLALIYPLVLASLAFDGHAYIDDPALQSPLFVVHIAPAIFGYAALAVSALYGVAYLMLYHEIKAHRFGIVYHRLPPLEALASYNFRGAVAGFAFLTVALVAGSIWAARALEGLPFADPKLLLAAGTWLLYGIAIAGRQFLGWSGRRTAGLTILGFGLVLFSLVVVNLALTSFHAWS